MLRRKKMQKENKNGCCILQLRLKPEPWQVDVIETRFRILEHLKNSLTAYELRRILKELVNIVQS